MVPGPFLMLVAQAAVAWLALGITCWQVFSGERRGAWVAFAIGMSPPVFGLLGTIWKDVEMAAALLMAFALLLVSSRTKHGGRRRFAMLVRCLRSGMESPCGTTRFLRCCHSASGLRG